MTKILKHSVVAATLALGVGAAQAYPLEDRILGCSQVQPYLDVAYTLRTDGQPVEVAKAILVDAPELLPAHRFIVQVILKTLYAIPSTQLPEFEHYRVLSFSVCLENIGAGFVELEPEIGVRKNLRREG